MKNILSLILFVFLSSTHAFANMAAFSELESALNAQSTATDYEEWHHARDFLVENADAILHPLLSEDQCHLLEGMKETDLLAIHEFLALAPASKCRDRLLLLVELIRADQSFKFTHTLDVFRSTGVRDYPKLNPCGPTKPAKTKLGPSIEKVLDTSGGPRMVTGDVSPCQIVLTFDDGPHPTYSRELLASLKAENVSVNYFTIGNNVGRLPQIVKEQVAAGHIVGNHSQSHANMPKLSYAAGMAEIANGFKALLGVFQNVPPFFRFPYGAHTQSLRSYNKSNNVAEFFWNMDTLDWKLKDPMTLYRNVLKEIEREKRGILLFHDVHPQTITIMPHLLQALREARYEIVLMKPKFNYHD